MLQQLCYKVCRHVLVSCPVHQSVVICCDQGSDHILNYYILLGYIAFLVVNLSVHWLVVHYGKRCYNKWQKGEMCLVERIYVLDTKKKNTDKNSAVHCFATSVYSKEPDTDSNVRLQAMIALEKRHEKERESLLC